MRDLPIMASRSETVNSVYLQMIRRVLVKFRELQKLLKALQKPNVLDSV